MKTVEFYPNSINNTFKPILKHVINDIISERDPNQIIARNGDTYLNRWMLGRKMQVPKYENPYDFVRYGLMSSEIENIYIHQFVRGDREDPHCHPWPNISIIIDGYYTEHIYDIDSNFIESIHAMPGDIIFRQANAVHAIVDASPYCTTLFISGPKEKDWGFYKDGQFIRNEAYPINSVLPIPAGSVAQN